MAPWQYLFKPFDQTWFNPIWSYCVGFAAILFFFGILLFLFQQRRLSHYQLFVDMNEWLFWTSMAISLLLLMYAVFAFDFLFVLPTMIAGIGLFIWIRFFHFPPMLTAYEERLARQRYFQRHQSSHPESTIQRKAAKPAATRRRRR